MCIEDLEAVFDSGGICFAFFVSCKGALTAVLRFNHFG
jgi:hypothetical protein